MKRISLFLITVLCLISIYSCATDKKGLIQNPQLRGPFKFGKVDIQDMHTAPYLINSIMIKVQNKLQLEGMLYKEDSKGPYYTIDLLIKAEYPAFVRHEDMASYTILETKVILKDPDGKEIKQGNISTINAFKGMTADYTEIEHAKEIVRFVTSK